MQDFRKLDVWQLAHSLTLSIYRITRTFPAEERFGLIDQMRRAAVSIEANLAEGTGRGGDADCHENIIMATRGALGFARFVQIAFGSACELECHLLIARDLKFGSAQYLPEAVNSLERVKRMLSGLLRKLRAHSR